nr:hypothetical protein [Streptomyces sp. I6]
MAATVLAPVCSAASAASSAALAAFPAPALAAAFLPDTFPAGAFSAAAASPAADFFPAAAFLATAVLGALSAFFATAVFGAAPVLATAAFFAAAVFGAAPVLAAAVFFAAAVFGAAPVLAAAVFFAVALCFAAAAVLPAPEVLVPASALRAAPALFEPAPVFAAARAVAFLAALRPGSFAGPAVAPPSPAASSAGCSRARPFDPLAAAGRPVPADRAVADRLADVVLLRAVLLGGSAAFPVVSAEPPAPAAVCASAPEVTSSATLPAVFFATTRFLPFVSLAAAPAAAVVLADAVFFTAVFFATMAAAPSHIVILLAHRAGTINRPQRRGNGARRSSGPPRAFPNASLHPLCPAPRP